MNIKLDISDSSFKQLEYFLMTNWKKLKSFSISSNENITHLENIQDKFDFPLLEKLILSIFYFIKM